jgi:O-antigen/teichoic acid export membrane protein
MGVAIVFLTWVLAPLVVRLLTQQRFSEFNEAVSILRLLSLALLVAYFNHLTGYTIIALGRQRPYVLITLVALVFNIIANLNVIPRFSYYGAATVTIFTETIILTLTTLLLHRLMKFFPSLLHFPKTIGKIIRKGGGFLER